MGAYLIDHPPVRDQFYKTRNRPLTGCTVLHTAESVMDAVGPDTGAEAVAEFIRTRTTPGSYHDIADSDSYVHLVPYESGAYHDGTGSNNWALSISFACGTHHWRQMSPERRAGFLRNGARAFAAQQAWRKAHGYPLTELRRITKAQSDAGVSGFIYHGDRDPGRRTDPGKNPPDLFPFDEWIAACRTELAGPTPVASEEDDMVRLMTTDKDGRLLCVDHGAHTYWHVKSPTQVKWLTDQGMLQLEGKQPFAMIADYAEVTAPVAAASVPVAAGSSGSLSDADLERIAKAVADEQFRRQAA